MIRSLFDMCLGMIAGYVIWRVFGEVIFRWTLRRRVQRQLKQQKQLRVIIEGVWEEIQPQPIRCICQWFDHDTLLIDPRCQAIDHGNLSRLLDSVRKSIRARAPYRFKNRQD